jgi:7-cyano-7-deazaguanine synthase
MSTPEAVPLLPNYGTVQKRALLLLSGGLDSAACIPFLLRQGVGVEALHVSYGQLASKKEESAAKAIANHYGISIKHVQLDSSHCIYSEGEITGRNAFLLSLGLMHSNASTAYIGIGIHSGTGYYDCSENFLQVMQSLCSNYTNGAVKIAAPFRQFSKREIWAYAKESETPINLTYSCQAGTSPTCGKCPSCLDLNKLNELSNQ